MKRIPTPKISDILKYDFMKPINLSAQRLAQAIHIPSLEIKKLLNNQSKITPDMSIRLGRYFGVDDGYLLRIQNELNLRNTERKNYKQYQKIKPRVRINVTRKK